MRAAAQIRHPKEAMAAWTKAYEALRGDDGRQIYRFKPEEYQEAVKSALGTVDAHIADPNTKLQFFELL